MALCLLASQAVPARAVQTQTVGTYQIRVFWKVDPAVAGQINAISVSVYSVPANEGVYIADYVRGLEHNLTLVVGHAGQSRLLTVQPGNSLPSGSGIYVGCVSVGCSMSYDASVIPTQPGDYTSTVIGIIGNTPVNLTFGPGPGFEPVQNTEAASFPQPTQSIPLTSLTGVAILGGVAVAGVVIGALVLPGFRPSHDQSSASKV